MKLNKILTDLLELLGLALILAGIYIAFGLAVALIAAGAAVIGVSFLLTRGGRK